MNAASLPTDPDELLQIISRQSQVIAERERVIAEMQARHKAELDVKQAEIDAILRRFYGPRSESFDPRQLLIFGLQMAEDAPVDASVAEAESGEKLVTRNTVSDYSARSR